jgi:hypothetical protein
MTAAAMDATREDTVETKEEAMVAVKEATAAAVVDKKEDTIETKEEAMVAVKEATAAAVVDKKEDMADMEETKEASASKTPATRAAETTAVVEEKDSATSPLPSTTRRSTPVVARRSLAKRPVSCSRMPDDFRMRTLMRTTWSTLISSCMAAAAVKGQPIPIRSALVRRCRR